MFRRKCKSVLHIFCMVTTCVVFAVALFTTVINPEEEIPSAVLWQIPVISMLTSLMTLIYPWDRTMGKAEIIVRIIVHYILILLLVLWAGWLFEWYRVSVRNVICMSAAVTVIYAVVSGISWTRASRDARRMNERLQELKNSVDKP